MLDSIMSAAMSLSLWLRWFPKSGSGQWRSRMKDWSASSFQNRSSEVAHPLLEIAEVITGDTWSDGSRFYFSKL